MRGPQQPSSPPSPTSDLRDTPHGWVGAAGVPDHVHAPLDDHGQGVRSAWKGHGWGGVQPGRLSAAPDPPLPSWRNYKFNLIKGRRHMGRKRPFEMKSLGWPTTPRRCPLGFGQGSLMAAGVLGEPARNGPESDKKHALKTGCPAPFLDQTCSFAQIADFRVSLRFRCLGAPFDPWFQLGRPTWGGAAKPPFSSQP